MEKEKVEVSFEENMKELETIVKELESGDTKLDDAIEKFQKAMTLAKECDEKLKNAEENISKILNDDGTLSEFKVEE